MGAIWRVPDNEVKFPQDLNRTYHRERIVIIIEHSNLNFDLDEELILIAPLSSQIEQYHALDIFVEPSELNSLDKPCYVRMRAIQFIPKAILKKYVGKIENEAKYDILATLNFYINGNNN